MYFAICPNLRKAAFCCTADSTTSRSEAKAGRCFRAVPQTRTACKHNIHNCSSRCPTANRPESRAWPPARSSDLLSILEVRPSGPRHPELQLAAPFGGPVAGRRPRVGGPGPGRLRPPGRPDTAERQRLHFPRHIGAASGTLGAPRGPTAAIRLQTPRPNRFAALQPGPASEAQRRTVTAHASAANPTSTSPRHSLSDLPSSEANSRASAS